MVKTTSAPVVYAIWTTSAGPMAAVKNARGLTRVILPHYAFRDLSDLLAFEHPGSREAPEEFTEMVELSRAYFNTETVRFDAIDCDLPSEKTFTGRIMRACQTIPYGQTRSYSWLADAAGKPDGARAAAAALGKNPLPLIVPCHRVIYASGGLGGFSAPGGVEMKRRMLTIERVL